MMAQQGRPFIRVRNINHMTLHVSDLKRSVAFYQGLFGMPVVNRQENSVGLRIGSGPQHLGVSVAGANEKPAFDHFCMTTGDFNVERMLQVLAGHGVTKREEGSDARGALKAWVRMRGETPEFYLSDPDGIAVQIQDASYCGGGGPLGNMCPPTEASPTKGLLAMRDLSHFTLSSQNAERSRAFYRDVFGMSILAYQGPTAPALGIGSTRQFIMAAAGGGVVGKALGAPQTANIGHGCFTMQDFNPDRVLKLLGGAKEGTPELYFTDPDGILLQIQDVSYCGGAGLLGEVCQA
jgi:catechol 2,3-dioxygenase-like lactoylglutathione lyase family enzyme